MADDDRKDFSEIRFFADEVTRLRGEWTAFRDFIGSRLLQQDQAINHIQAIAGHMERVERTVEQYVKVWDELHGEARLWIASSGSDIEEFRRESEAEAGVRERAIQALIARLEATRLEFTVNVQNVVTELREFKKAREVADASIQTAKIGATERIIIAGMTLAGTVLGVVLSKIFGGQ